MRSLLVLAAASFALPLCARAEPATAAQGPQSDVPALMAHYGCTICHDTVESMAGPPWVEVAAKYRGNPNAAAILTRVVRKGVHGSGPWPMPPLPEVTAKDARAIVHYILTIRRPQARPHEPET